MTAEHGTLRGVRWHVATGVPRCTACRRAAADQRADQRKRAYLRGGRPLLVDSCGVHRRLRALAAIGWSATALAAELGVHRSAVQKLYRSRRSNLATVAAVGAVYDRLSMTPGPHRQAAAYAAAQGWPPPLAWDDDELDDPAAESSRGRTRDTGVDEVAVARAQHGEDIQLNRAEGKAAVEQLTAGGLSATEIAERLRVTPRAVDRRRAAGRATTNRSSAA